MKNDILLTQAINSGVYKIIQDVIRENRLHKKRCEKLTALGFDVIPEVLCGTGGVGSVRIKGKSVYVQITCGHTKHNYATCVKIGEAVNYMSGTKFKPCF